MKNVSRKIIQTQLAEIAEESHDEALLRKKEEEKFTIEYLEIRKNEDARCYADMVGFVE